MLVLYLSGIERTKMIELMFITNDTQVAQIADESGVDRVWIDLETLGKQERQGHMDSVKSRHNIEDIAKVKSVLKMSKMQVRINPINKNSQQEIEKVIAAGADIIMLPMFKTVQEVKCFLEYVSGRATTVLLFETRESVEQLVEILKLEGIDEVHIGLNDLHLSYHLKFMFELVSNGCVESLCKCFQKKGIPYGFGGIGRFGTGIISPQQILAEHIRLGSRRVILSRSFCNTQEERSINRIRDIFKMGIDEIREYERRISHESDIFFEHNKIELYKQIRSIAEKMQN